MIVDGHLDLAYNALVDGRDYTRSALAIRAEEAGGPIETSNGRCMVGLPELLAGDVRLIVGTLFALPRSEAGKGECGYVNQHGAHEQALAQLGIYRRWAAEVDEIDLVRTAADLDAAGGPRRRRAADRERRLHPHASPTWSCSTRRACA